MALHKILLWEPDLRLRGTLEVSLRRQHFDVLVASNESEAIQFARQESPTFGIVSAVSPTGESTHDPYDTCAQLVREGALKVCAFGALRPTRDMVVRAVRAGALDFFALPIPEKTLAERLDAAYIRARQQARLEPEFSTINFPPDAIKIEDRIDYVAQQASSIRAMPHAVSKILLTLEDQKTGTRELAQAVESDPTIAAMVLKLARSPYHGGTSSISTVKQAVSRLGFRQTKELVLGLSITRLVPPEGTCFGLNRLWYWLHSLATGLLAKLMGQRISSRGSQNAFLAGLLHDIGKLFLDDFLPGDYQGVVQRANLEGRRLFDVEREMLHRDHAELGARIAIQWGFPSEIADAIGGHHDVPAMIKSSGRMLDCTTLVGLANQLSKALLIGCGGDYIVDELPMSVWSAAHFARLKDAEFLDSFHKELEEFCAFLNVDSSEAQPPFQAQRPARIFTLGSQNSVLTAITLNRLGYDVSKFAGPELVSEEPPERSLGLIHGEDLGAVQGAIADLEQRGWCNPIVGVVSAPKSNQGEWIDDRKPWYRVTCAPLDCYAFVNAIREAEAGFEAWKGPAPAPMGRADLEQPCANP